MVGLSGNDAGTINRVAADRGLSNTTIHQQQASRDLSDRWQLAAKGSGDRQRQRQRQRKPPPSSNAVQVRPATPGRCFWVATTAHGNVGDHAPAPGWLFRLQDHSLQR